MSNAKYLTEGELRNLFLLNEKCLHLKTKLDQQDLSRSSNKLEQKFLATRLELVQYKLEKLNLQYQELGKQYQIQKQSLNDFNKQLEEKYDLKPGWGLDPETGELDNGKEVSLLE